MVASVLYIQYSTPIWNYGLVPSFKLFKAETLRNLSSNCLPPSFHPPSHDYAKLFSRVQLFATPWTVTHQAPLFMGFLFFQARILEWVAMPSSMGSSQPRDRTRSLALQEDSLPSEPPGKSKNTGVGSLSLHQGIFPPRNWTQSSCTAGRFFTSWATREDLLNRWQYLTHISWVVLQIWKPSTKWKVWTTWWPWAHTPGFQELKDW